MVWYDMFYIDICFLISIKKFGPCSVSVDLPSPNRFFQINNLPPHLCKSCSTMDPSMLDSSKRGPWGWMIYKGWRQASPQQESRKKQPLKIRQQRVSGEIFAWVLLVWVFVFFSWRWIYDDIRVDFLVTIIFLRYCQTQTFAAAIWDENFHRSSQNYPQQ